MIYGTLVQENTFPTDRILQDLQEIRNYYYPIQESNPLEDFGKYLIQSQRALELNVSELTSCSNDIVNAISENGLGKRTREYIQIRIQDMWRTIAADINRMKVWETDKRFIGLDPNKVARAYHLTIYAIAINTVLYMIGTSIAGPDVGTVLMGCISAPLVEEACKQISVKG